MDEKIFGGIGEIYSKRQAFIKTWAGGGVEKQNGANI